ncbi:MAG: Gas vesicle protein [Candidatus Brocadiaceae bacterium]|nr:Gas vesicle protein [Candidatus Brocadiaceae bacterium]
MPIQRKCLRSRMLELFRDNVFLKPTGATQEEKLELGRMFETILGQEREKHTATVQGILNPFCHEKNRLVRRICG